ncbi:MAG: hypothetical protein NC120_00725 [Ruminococcus sp.]|nr:hypothetical protein [Ruminococcus sp.]
MARSNKKAPKRRYISASGRFKPLFHPFSPQTAGFAVRVLFCSVTGAAAVYWTDSKGGVCFAAALTVAAYAVKRVILPRQAL